MRGRLASPDWRQAQIRATASIREAIRVLDENRLQIALVVDEGHRLIGTVSDTDVRRAVLHGLSLEGPVAAVMNADPATVSAASRTAALRIMRRKGIHQIPVIDEDGRVLGLEMLGPSQRAPLEERWVVMMAGGRGTRLHPLTKERPKSLLEVGGRPLLDVTLEGLAAHGFRRFYLCVNYKAEMIESHAGDGSRFGIDIEYVREDRPMGTAGALGLLPERPAEGFLVMNADLLTRFDFAQLLHFHELQGAEATMCVYGYDAQVPYGVVRLEGNRMTSIEERPVERHFINAGIYLLEPSVLDLVPRDTAFDMPTLFEALLARGRATAAFPIREYWLDIGRFDDLERANADYPVLFGEDSAHPRARRHG